MTLSHVISLECPGTAATQDTRVARRSTKCTQARVGQGGMQTHAIILTGGRV